MTRQIDPESRPRPGPSQPLPELPLPELPLSDSASPLTPALRARLDELPDGARVLDVGCLGWKLHRHRPTLEHHGCDLARTTSLPDGVTYRQCDVDGGELPWPDDHFDLVVASHVIEHLDRPLALVSEMVRVCRPGGHLYLEAPSERACLAPSMLVGPHGFLSHWDDPTHRRPWSPGALYRALLCHSCMPTAWGHDTRLAARLLFPWTLLRCVVTGDGDRLTDAWWHVVGFAAYASAVKPHRLSGRLAFQYRSLKGIDEAAIREHFRPLMAPDDGPPGRPDGPGRGG